MRTLVFLAVAVLSQSCFTDNAYGWRGSVRGEGDVETRTLSLDDFSGITLSLAADVYLTQGAEQTVRVEGQSNIIDEIKTEVRDGVWRIKSEKNLRNYRELRIYITIPRLHQAEIAGSGSIFTETPFKTETSMYVGINGSGDIKMDLVSEAMKIEINGSGNITLKGTASHADFDINGSGDIDAEHLTMANATANINGSGNCAINASESLEAEINGSGDLRYVGTPKIKARSTGSGSIVSM